MGCDHVEATPVAFGVKGHEATIGRELRIAIVGGMPGQPEWFAAVRTADPEIEPAIARTVRGIDDPITRRGKRRILGKSRLDR